MKIKELLTKAIAVIGVTSMLAVMPAFGYSEGLVTESTAKSVLRTLSDEGCFTTYDGEKGEIPSFSDKAILYVPSGKTAREINVEPNAISFEGVTDDLLVTGARIIIKDLTSNQKPDYEAYIVVYGDAANSENTDSEYGDGIVDIFDIVATRDFIVNSDSCDVTNIKQAAMDVFLDYTVDISDVVLMREFVVNK